MSSDRAEPEPDDLVVREALVAAVEVARERLRSPDPDLAAGVPRSLWRICGFRQLSRSALAQVRAALDTDDDFRALVGEAVTSDDVDEASWLFLRRPERWRERIGERSRQDDTGEEAAPQTPSAVRRKLKATEAARDRALADVEAVQARIDAISADLRREQAVRSRLESELTEVRSALESARQAAGEAERRVRMAEGKRAEEAHRVEQVMAARDQLRAERDELRRTVADQGGATGAPDRSPPAPPQDGDRPAVAGTRHAVDQGVAGAVDQAAAAAAALAASLAEAARRLRDRSDDPGADPAGDVGGGEGNRARPARAGRPRRQPVPLPPGVFDDSAEAARHLLSVQGMVLLVDGYNATIGRWPELPIDEQRDRLIAAVTELHARCGARVRVVFDGVEPVARHRTTSRGVSVTFTQEGREADDAIIDAVATADEGPVVVASDDRRVRHGAAVAGANLLTLDQLFGVLRREA